MLFRGALKCGERWIAKSYKTSKGCPRLYMQTRVQRWEIENEKKQQMN